MSKPDRGLEKFAIKGIQATELDLQRGWGGTKTEFGGWGEDLSKRPYTLADGRHRMQSKSELASYVEACSVRDNALCIHGNVNTECQYRQPGEVVCTVRLAAGGNQGGFL